LLAFDEGVELEWEQQGDRKTAKLILPLSVQQTYVLLESMLKSSGNAAVLDQLRFVTDKDGSLSRLSTSDGSVSASSVSEEVTELKIASYAVITSAQR
jgi:hypothetical protein